MFINKSVAEIYNRPVEILQKLIQYNTTNPPGNEAECINYIRGLLSDAGIESVILAKKPDRPNLIARIHGEGKANPLLLYGHVDVVTTEGQKWDHPPFEGKIVDGFVWGRGALDMKSGIAMMLTSFLRAKAKGLKPAGDIVLTIVSDEEPGGDFGAKFLVENHPDFFKNIRYAIGEFGGFPVRIGKKRFYPITISEKQICWIRATVHGQGGHGSVPVRGGAMMQLSKLLKQLNKKDLPVHITPPSKIMVEATASGLGGTRGFLLKQLNNPWMTKYILKLMGARGKIMYPLFHNTISPTILHGSKMINVIPSEVSVDLDGRLLPGFQPDDMINELRRIAGKDVDFEIIRFDSGPPEPDMGLFSVLSHILQESDPEGIPIPFLISAVTDGRFFSRLGIQTYGFLPMILPDDFNFTETVHAANERVPVAAVEFGTNSIFKLLQRFGQD
ncbi:MAG: putative succinyl-diaminopimelate desuccinylase [Deltaproteobacteria bacterium ADurb.Bin022]|nr:MAG: putative succinyl-diaminopimelate desuccinylase [Deltaproteobacteria bacterium ADurb.Bin022]